MWRAVRVWKKAVVSYFKYPGMLLKRLRETTIWISDNLRNTSLGCYCYINLLGGWTRLLVYVKPTLSVRCLAVTRVWVCNTVIAHLSSLKRTSSHFHLSVGVPCLSTRYFIYKVYGVVDFVIELPMHMTCHLLSLCLRFVLKINIRWGLTFCRSIQHHSPFLSLLKYFLSFFLSTPFEVFINISCVLLYRSNPASSSSFVSILNNKHTINHN